ncbi:conserved hypothetical protein [Uncinocarpus reesii 1704]|uniref:Factor arrest protein 11 n=1 Tax=Uncinocarpus reesii (strain UAMH 1704) TaxID=336963 RepID=C4JR63_UNCRE|nr:uncharacterized protein UREG_03545 [Uncinocarpus reesii 1704]EEP78699.1 conserved hypothetical protein [Uncinocarpus reesii 1704]
MASGEGNQTGQHIVRADEVDQTGMDISPMPDEQLMPNVVRDLKAEQARSQDEKLSEYPQRHPAQPPRPELRRNTIAPPPPLQPPPPAPTPRNLEPATDSLSLAQLRKIVQDLPKTEEHPVYAFSYADSQPFPEELDEWFQCNEADRLMLLGSKASFEQNWSQFVQSLHGNVPDITWLNAAENLKKTFLEGLLTNLTRNTDISARIEALNCICYLITGIWGITAGKTADDYPTELSEKEAAETPGEKSLQIQWMEKNADLIRHTKALVPLFHYLKEVFDSNQSATYDDIKGFDGDTGATAYCAARDREMNLTVTIFYFLVEIARRQQARQPDRPFLKDEFAALDPNYLVIVAQIIARLRWEDVTNFPLTRRAKTVLEPKYDGQASNSKSSLPALTASPLDYHTFRQEITSKYPSYNPPPALIPLELGHNSILPPLPTVSNRVNTSTLFSGVSASSGTGNGSILHKSVHIATPAPSPPPSPGGPGKAGKKQNYQTNQNFPFMYPPLDSLSNNIGGKGSSDIQDTLVGQKWEGSDVPASIIEAGKLFSSRMRMTRAIRQLWEERERFLKYDRGWGANGATTQKQILPNLQSVVIVLLKEILTNITADAGQSNGSSQNGQKSGVMSNGINGAQTSTAGAYSMPDHVGNLEDLDAVRSREIKSKGISGVLLLLLKWFKRSHILQFEYMTQLLLDSNYLPLILKMFIHQDVDRAVAQRNDRKDLSFFHFCHVHSDQPPLALSEPEPERLEDSEEEAVPPPISRSRSSLSVLNAAATPSEKAQDHFTDGAFLPEVDELGFPTAPLPDTPITEFSFRNFFSAINYLHIMQKITRNKAHRCLLLRRATKRN